jgi:hypothetical protein
MSRFFATPEDLLPVLSSVETRRQVVYTLMGHISAPEVRSFSAAAELPTLFEPAPADSVSAGHAYLVTEATTKVSIRELSVYQGSPRWVIDQLHNPDSTVLQHGGYFGARVLLHGSVRTVSQSPVSASLQRAFDGAIRRHFVRVQAFYVGKQAETLLDSGYRLTFSARAPREYDLRRQQVPNSDA